MNRITSSRIAMAFIALAGLASLVNAQPGPVSGTGSGPGQAMPAPGGLAGLLSPDMLTNYLRDKGHKVTPTKASDGRPVLQVQIVENGWEYKLEIEFLPNLQGFYIDCPLAKAGAPMSAAQLTEILKANYRFTPDYFLIRGFDNRLALETNVGANINTATFQAILNRFLGNVRASQSVWDSSNWGANGALAGQIAPKQ